MNIKDIYVMENLEEANRLEIKTDPEAVRKQANWCGLKPGQRVLDAGCGPGITTAILHDMIQPEGEIIGVDYSEKRIQYAIEKHGEKQGIGFRIHDIRKPMDNIGLFDLIWIRFVLEYNRNESLKIVKNMTKYLKPGGRLCLFDLDHNCLSHYELPKNMEDVLFQLVKKLEKDFNFDPFLFYEQLASLKCCNSDRVVASILKLL